MSRSLRARSVAATLGVALALGVSASPARAATAPVEERGEQVVTADVLPTVQIDDGIVWAQAVTGDLVFAGGSFENARPAGAEPGTALMPRKNLLAYDVTTGVATDFAPHIEGTVKALAVSVDGKTLYVGGSFKRVDGKPRHNIAAFDVATGALVSAFAPAVGGSYVNAIVATETAVYFGGLFSHVRGVERKNLAAVDHARGALLGWAPTTNQQVDAMTTTGDKIIAGGRFSVVSKSRQTGLTALDPTTGAILPWTVSTYIQNGEGNERSGIWSLTSTGDRVYGTGWSYYQTGSGRKIEGVFSARASDGALVWQTPCRGDMYGVTSDGQTVYTTGHPHDCERMGAFPHAMPAPGNMRHASAFTIDARGTQAYSQDSWFRPWNGTATPSMVTWAPEWLTGQASGSGQAGWTILHTDDYVVVGGEFIGVNNQRQQGLVRFAKHPPAGANDGPRLSGAEWMPAASSPRSGSVRVTIATNWDRDNGDLTYDLVTSDGTVLATTTAASYSWARNTIALEADGLPQGEQLSFAVVARDRDGNNARSGAVEVTVAGTSASSSAPNTTQDGP